MTLAERIQRMIPHVKATGQAPLLGIPIPGERPFVVPRDRFRIVTGDGLQVTSAMFGAIGTNGSTRRTLTVEGRSGRVKRRYVLYDTGYQHPYMDVVRPLHEWAERKRAAKAKAKPKPSKYDAAIARLRRELDALPARAPQNPLLYKRHYEPSLGERAEVWRWYAEKPERKRFAAYYRMFRAAERDAYTVKGGLPAVYAALRRDGVGFRSLSKLHKHEVERLAPCVSDYVKRLYCWTDANLLREKPWSVRLDGDRWGERPHVEERAAYAAVIRQRQALESQIAALQELAQEGGQS